MEDNNNTSLDTTIKSSERQASVIPQEQFNFNWEPKGRQFCIFFIEHFYCTQT